jgi:sugar phosphate isomerase/epimerase
MDPVLAMYLRTTSCGNGCSLAHAHPFEGIEVTLDPYDVAPSVSAAAALIARSPLNLALRYHFPLGPLELSGPSPGVADTALAAMMDAVNAISLAGGDCLTVHAALPSDAYGTPRFAATGDRLGTLVEEGRKRGVAVALENLRWGATAEPHMFLELVRMSGSTVTLDVGHAVSSESSARGYSAERFVADCGPHITGAHVYDRETDHHHPPTDLDRIGGALDALCDAGCPWWTIELHDYAEALATHALLVAYLDERSAAGAPLCA